MSNIISKTHRTVFISDLSVMDILHSKNKVYITVQPDNDCLAIAREQAIFIWSPKNRPEYREALRSY